MGWKNSSAWFMMAVNETVADIRAEFRRRDINAQIASYVDDLAIASDRMDDHVRAVMTSLEVFKSHGWTIKPSKVVWAARETEFLGRTLSQDGVNISDDIRSRAQQMPPPTNVRELRSALGLMRCMLNHCRIDTASLALLQKMLKWKGDQIVRFWKEHEDKWAEITRQFDKCWYLNQGIPSVRLDLYVDACGHGYGFALFDADKQRLVHMGCGHLDATKLKSSGHAEALALKRSLHSCRPFIIGRQFRIFTDSTVVLNGTNPKNQSLVVQRFLDSLNLSAGSVHHVDGIKNTIADILSRSRFWQTNLTNPKPMKNKQGRQTCHQAKQNEYAAESEEVQEDVAPDGWYESLPEFLLNNTYPKNWNEIKKKRIRERAKDFRMCNSKLEYFNGCQWVRCWERDEDKTEALTDAHDRQGHYGEAETERRLRRFAYWPEIHRDVKQHVRTCINCQRQARRDTPRAFRNMSWIEANEAIAMDFIGPFQSHNRKKYILACVDLCTRFPMLSATIEASSEAVVKMLERWTHLFGNPSMFVADNATAFASKKVTAWLAEHGIRRRSIPAYTPQCNGSCERLNQEVLRRLRRMVNHEEKWAHYLPTIEQTLRSSKNKISGLSSFQMMFGYEPDSSRFIQVNRPRQ